jgi:Tfp pilus assembly protein PilF
LTGAIADYNRAIQLHPRLVAVHQNRGLARLLLGREEAADQDFARCLELDSSLKPAIEQLIKTTKERMAARK